MVEKAKLDVLENFPDIDRSDMEIPINDQELPLPVTSGKWALNKLLVISIPFIIVIFIIAGIIWVYYARTINVSVKKSKPQAGISETVIEKKIEDVNTINAQAKINQANENNVNLEDFIIDLKDKNGKSKILKCDFVLELNTAQDIAELTNKEEIRNIIYQTTTGKNSSVLKIAEERIKLKKELIQELNKMLGDGFVKKIYFTNYLIM